MLPIPIHGFEKDSLSFFVFGPLSVVRCLVFGPLSVVRCLVFVLCPLSVVRCPIFAQDSPAVLKLSLADCLRLAEEQNVKLKAMNYDIEGAQWKRQEARAGFKPVIELTNRMAPVPTDAENPLESFFDGNITFFNTTKVGVGMPVYTFDKFKTADRLAVKGIDAAETKQIKEKEQIRYDVKRLYFGLLLSAELENLVDVALQKINDQLDKEEAEPKHTPYEIAKLKVFKLELERRRAEGKEKAETARGAMRFQLGLPRDQFFVLADAYLDPVSFQLQSPDHYFQKAAARRPDARLVEIGIKAKQLEWELEKKKLLPNVGVGAFVEIGRTTDPVRNLARTDDFSDPFNYTRAGVGLEIKGQFDFHGSKARRNRLKSEYYKVSTEESLAKEGILLEVKEAYEEAKRTESALRFSEERKKLARQMVFLSKSNLEIGVGEETEYTDALQLLLFTRGEYLKAVFDYNVALAKLEWKTGGEVR